MIEGEAAMADKMGFVGLGNMGGPMALNVVNAGFELVVHDIDPAKVVPSAAAGAAIVDTPSAAAAVCRRTICMVETTDQAEAVILGDSTGNSVQFQNRVPRMLARNFAPGGTIDISFKDQELETGFAKELGMPLLMANLSQQVYQMGRAAGLNKEDGSAIVKIYERLAGVKIDEGRA
jgi:3-hydroxyisobutyrate dehydrogenase-like beta-hydroxyacid dehydrogenase